MYGCLCDAGSATHGRAESATHELSGKLRQQRRQWAKEKAALKQAEAARARMVEALRHELERLRRERETAPQLLGAVTQPPPRRPHPSHSPRRSSTACPWRTARQEPVCVRRRSSMAKTQDLHRGLSKEGKQRTA